MMFLDAHINNISGRLWTLLILVLPAVTSGCASFNWINWQETKWIEATASNPVTTIICIWEPAEGQGLDGLPTRGLAGQILFFTKQSPTPVMVDGDVRVYLYDDRGSVEERGKPIHQFDFIGDAWTVHLNNSKLGPAYNVFIPYVRKHNQQVVCGVQLRLKPNAGPTMFSQMVNLTLPGLTPEERRPVHNNPTESSENLTENSGMKTVPVASIVRKEGVSASQFLRSGHSLTEIDEAVRDTNDNFERVDSSSSQHDNSASTRGELSLGRIELVHAQTAAENRDNVSHAMMSTVADDDMPLTSDTASMNHSTRNLQQRRSHRLASVANGDVEADSGDVARTGATGQPSDRHDMHPLDRPAATKHPLLEEFNDSAD